MRGCARASGHSYGEGDDEVLGGDEPSELALDPLLAVVVLAARTVAMAAGVRYEGLV